MASERRYFRLSLLLTHWIARGITAIRLFGSSPHGAPSHFPQRNVSLQLRRLSLDTELPSVSFDLRRVCRRNNVAFWRVHGFGLRTARPDDFSDFFVDVRFGRLAVKTHAQRTAKAISHRLDEMRRYPHGASSQPAFQ